MALSISGSFDMPLAETYFLASKARAKLSREANKADHNLRILVSHANLLDNLMDSLSAKRKAGSILTKPQVTTIHTTTEGTSTTTFGDLPKPDKTQSTVSLIQDDDEEDDEEEMYYSSSDEEFEYDEEDSSEEDSDDEEEYGFQRVEYASFEHMKQQQFRVLPTVDESPLEPEIEHVHDDEYSAESNSNNVPLLSYSSEEESDGDQDMEQKLNIEQELDQELDQELEVEQRDLEQDLDSSEDLQQRQQHQQHQQKQKQSKPVSAQRKPITAEFSRPTILLNGSLLAVS